MSKTIIKFTRQHGKYVSGDIAGFDADTAGKFLRAKVAVAYEQEDDEPALAGENGEPKPETAGKKS